MSENGIPIIKSINHPAFSDFDLIHKGKHYPINSILIESLSPKIQEMRFANPSIKSIEVPPIDGCFSEFVEFLYGEKVIINIENAQFFLDLCQFFGLSDASSKIEKFILDKMEHKSIEFYANIIINGQCSEENLKDYLLKIEAECQERGYDFDSIIKDLEKPMITKFGCDTLMKVYNSHPQKFISLLNIINIRRLSSEDQAEVFSTQPIDLNQFRFIFNDIHLVGSMKQKTTTFYPDFKNPSTGGMLKTLFGRGNCPRDYNVSIKGDTKIGEFLSDNLIEPTEDSYCLSKEFIEIDLGPNCANVKAYGIKFAKDPKASYPITWEVLGLTIDSEWVRLDYHENEDIFHNISIPRLFFISNNSKLLVAIKFIPIKTKIPEQFLIAVNSFDIYGQLYS